MKRYTSFLLIAVLMLSGCASLRDDPFRVDTVVQIPVDPTDAPTETPTEAPTEAPTEIPTEAPTEPQETTAKSSGSSKGNGSNGQTSGKTEPKATKPPATEPEIVISTPPTEVPTELVTEPPFDPSSYTVGSLAYALLDELNAARLDASEAELSISERLSGIAYLRAKEGSVSWSHTRPDGRDYTSALSDYGYSYGDAAELMVYTSGSSDAASLAAKWMNSDSHSRKILSGSFSKVGIGIFRDDGVTYVVCLLVG